MIFTLQKYIFRELLRAFLLTAIALTCMMGFGGGMVNLMRNEGLSAHEIIKVLMCLMPIVLAYSLPVSALFSTTITYGRFATDNEITACRASGINIYKLLMPAVLLSVLVFATTFTLQNFLIPNLASSIERLIKADIQKIAYMKLKKQGYIDQMGFTLHCGNVDSTVPPQLLDDGTMTAGQIQLSGVAFMDHKSGVPNYYGTANNAAIVFDSYNESPTVSINLSDVRMFNEKQGQMIQTAYYEIRPMEIPALSKQKIKFLPLPELLTVAEDPLAHAQLKTLAGLLEKQFRSSLAYEALVAQIQEFGECRFQDEKQNSSITADNFRQRTDRDGSLILEGNVILKQTLPGGMSRTFTGKQAYITADTLTPTATPSYTIRMKNEVNVIESQKGTPDRFGERKDLTIGPISAPAAIAETAQNVTIDELIARDSPYAYNSRLNSFRGKLAKGIRTTQGKAIGEIHSRSAYSSSVLVLLLLGAGLGIIFKGGHFVSAFGLSFIPLLIVVIMIMTGKQLTTSGVPQVGIFVIWLGVILTTVANVIVLGKFLKR